MFSSITPLNAGFLVVSYRLSVFSKIRNSGRGIGRGGVFLEMPRVYQILSDGGGGAFCRKCRANDNGLRGNVVNVVNVKTVNSY